MTTLEKSAGVFIESLDTCNFLRIANKSPFKFGCIQATRSALEILRNSDITKLLELNVSHPIQSIIIESVSLTQLVADDRQHEVRFRYVILRIKVLNVNALLDIITSKLIDIVVRRVREVAVDWNHLIPINDCVNSALFYPLSDFHGRKGLINQL